MQELYKKYAQLLLKRCLNITKEKALVINAPIENIDFIRIVASEAYKLGIEDIYFDFEDEELKHEQLKSLNIEALSKSRFWNKEIYDDYAKKNAAFLILSAGGNNKNQDIASEKIDKANLIARTSRPIYKERQLKYEVSWCIASVATQKWAEKLFPKDKNALEKMWNLIFECCLVNEENPIEKWNEKIKIGKSRTTQLNALNLKRMHYKNEKGTDLTIELPEKHIWYSAGKKIAEGKEGIVNMPTEEVFTSPLRTGVNGIVYSSKPLIYGGKLINDFYLKFVNGKIIEVGAKQGLELLQKMITSCENADMLGEIALVEYNSPISQTNIVFYNTLFDENASCHLAIGSGFPRCIENGENMSKEELIKNGVNQSDTHVDFMIGTSDLTIVGISKDNKEITIFKNGNFAI